MPPFAVGGNLPFWVQFWFDDFQTLPSHSGVHRIFQRVSPAGVLMLQM